MEKQRLLYQQSRLHNRGAAEMVLQMISACKGTGAETHTHTHRYTYTQIPHTHIYTHTHTGAAKNFGPYGEKKYIFVFLFFVSQFVCQSGALGIVLTYSAHTHRYTHTHTHTHTISQ